MHRPALIQQQKQSLMECIKTCCWSFMKRRSQEQETPVITLRMPGSSGAASDEGKTGVTEDYLLSKLPPDGRDVPFVLPTFKASYVQPRAGQPVLQSSAWCTYAERKAELSGSTHFVYSPESGLHSPQTAEYVSPGSTRRDTLKKKTSASQSPAWTLRPGQQRLSSSMFDLTSPQGHMQRFDSASSVLSSTSSMMGSVESGLDSVTMSGDEQDLGKVCVRLSYQEAVEQVWITLVQCSDVSLPSDVVEQQQIGFKGIITIPKPVQFRSSVKEFCPNAPFLETFVFALRLQQLRCGALLLRLQTHVPRKRTVAECILSLRQLGSQETEHWLDLRPPSKSSVCHSELHVTTCFQPVNGRIQLQILAAQNLPVSSSPLSQVYFVKVEMHQLGRGVMKKKTRVMKATGGQCQWAETFHFPLAALDHVCSLSFKLYSRSSVRRKQCLGQIQLGFDSSVPEAVEQWKDTMAHPEKVVAAWHRLRAS